MQTCKCFALDLVVKHIDPCAANIAEFFLRPCAEHFLMEKKFKNMKSSKIYLFLIFKENFDLKNQKFYYK